MILHKVDKTNSFTILTRAYAVAVSVKMSRFYVFLAFLLATTSVAYTEVIAPAPPDSPDGTPSLPESPPKVTNGTGDPAPIVTTDPSKDDCKYCIAVEKKSNLETAVKDIKEYCDCFLLPNTSSTNCELIKGMKEGSKIEIFNVLEDYCKKANTINDILTQSIGKCSSASSSLVAGALSDGSTTMAPTPTDKSNMTYSNISTTVAPTPTDKNNLTSSISSTTMAPTPTDKNNITSSNRSTTVAPTPTDKSNITSSNSSTTMAPTPTDKNNITSSNSSTTVAPTPTDKNNITSSNSSTTMAPTPVDKNTDYVDGNNHKTGDNSTHGDIRDTGIVNKNDSTPADPVNTTEGANKTGGGSTATDTSGESASHHGSGEHTDNRYSLAQILWSIFLSFGAGILVAVVAKMLYNRYRKASYVIPPEQGMAM